MPKETSKIEQVKDKFQKGKATVKQGLKKTDEFVRAKPYKAIAIVAGVVAGLGTLAGYLLGKRKKE